MQHDGNVIALLIAALSAGRLGAVIRAAAGSQLGPGMARRQGSRAAIAEIVPANGPLGAPIFSPGREAEVEAFRRRITSAKLTSFNEDCIHKYSCVFN